MPPVGAPPETSTGSPVGARPRAVARSRSGVPAYRRRTRRVVHPPPSITRLRAFSLSCRAAVTNPPIAGLNGDHRHPRRRRSTPATASAAHRGWRRCKARPNAVSVGGRQYQRPAVLSQSGRARASRIVKDWVRALPGLLLGPAGTDGIAGYSLVRQGRFLGSLTNTMSDPDLAGRRVERGCRCYRIGGGVDWKIEAVRRRIVFGSSSAEAPLRNGDGRDG